MGWRKQKTSRACEGTLPRGRTRLGIAESEKAEAGAKSKAAQSQSRNGCERVPCGNKIQGGSMNDNENNTGNSEGLQSPCWSCFLLRLDCYGTSGLIVKSRCSLPHLS